MSDAVPWTEQASVVRHLYISTACQHEHHDYCKRETCGGREKVPARCKFCNTVCLCPCHAEED